MDFALFILLNAILLIRPEELLPDVAGLRSYLIVIVACLILSHESVFRQLSWESLKRQPITACVLGLVAAVGLSLVTTMNLARLPTAVVEFGKVVVYYLLLVGVVNSFARLRLFLSWLVVFAIVLTALGLLQFHGVIDVPSLRPAEQADFNPETGEVLRYPRLCSSGIYSDPNDLCMILVLGMGVCLYRLTEPTAGADRIVWAGAMLVFGYALALTRSRGGFLSLAVGSAVLLGSGLGWKRALPLVAIVLPVLAVVFGGRQTNFNVTGNDTSQARIQLWGEGLGLLPGYPIFGIGVDELADRVGLVAHNSYVQGFVETGIVGGTLFAGAWYLAVWGLARVPDITDVSPAGAAYRRLRPFVLACTAAYMTGMFSLTRNYVVPTYLMLGIAATFIDGATGNDPPPWFRLEPPLCRRLAAVGLGTLVFLKVFTQTFVTYG